jgi:anaerobic selenocysteine-containing dehydrogenase
MLGWLNVIIKEGLYDRDFVEKWTVGFEELKEAAAGFTPEKVAEITWLSPDKIKETARVYATTSPAAITWGFGIDKQGINATQAARARCCLRALTGNLDIPGGEPLGCADPVGRIRDEEQMELNEMLPPSQRAKQLGADRYPFFGFPGWEKNLEANRRLPREYMHPSNADRTSVAHTRDVFNAMLTGRPYPVKAAISVASNPIMALPDSLKTRDALKALDFYVVGEFFMTPSAALADYVFPICSTVETSELWLTEDFCVACPRGIDPLFERRNTYDFWRGLAIRLGQEEHWPWQTVDQAWDFMLSPLGMDFNKLLEQNGIFGRREYRNYEKYGFGTPSGKVELYSSIFQDLGNSPVPVYREVRELAGGDETNDEDFPLVLMTGSRFMPMYHSEQRQIEAARKKRPDPVVTLNPKTASSLGLNQDEWVWVETRYGSILMRLKLSDRIDFRMADADHGWWFPERGEPGRDLFGAFESNANVLCPDDPEVCSPEIGSWPHTGLPCRIRGR